MSKDDIKELELEVQLMNEYLDLEKMLSKGNKDEIPEDGKIAESFLKLKFKAEIYFSQKGTVLNSEDILLLEDIIRIIRRLPKKVQKENYEEILNFVTLPFVSKINNAFIFNVLINAEVGRITEENYKRIFELIESISFKEEDKIEKEKFDKAIKIIKVKILSAFPINMIESNIEFLLELVTENTLEKILKLRILNEQEVNNVVCYQRFFEYLLSKYENAIITNNVAVKIFNFVNPLLNNQGFEGFKRIIENERRKYEYPDMNKYSRYIPQDYSKEFIQMDETVFDEFCKDLEKIKILNGIIPEEYCDYIINQKINDKSNINQNLERYFSLLKRVFEDKTKHILEKEGIVDYTIYFIDSCEAREKGKTAAAVEQDENCIFFREEDLEKLCGNNFFIINHMFHETRHVKQIKLFREKDFTKLDGCIYNMVKEEILQKKDPSFYNRNYKRMYIESDARLAGAKGQAEYLLYLGVSPMQIIENIGYERKVDLESNSSFMTYQIKEEQKNAFVKVDKEGKIISISDKVSEFIKEDPTLLKEFPVLSLEFDENGERKSTVEILKDALAAQAPSEENLQDIYRKIFESTVTVELDSAIQSIDYISSLLNNKELLSDNLIYYISLIIKNEVLYSLSQSDNTNEKYNILKDKLREFVCNNPELEVSKAINEFLETGHISFDWENDKELKDIAKKTILNRRINNVDDLKRIIEDVNKISSFTFYNARSVMEMVDDKMKDDAYKILSQYFSPGQIWILERWPKNISELKKRIKEAKKEGINWNEFDIEIMTEWIFQENNDAIECLYMLLENPGEYGRVNIVCYFFDLVSKEFKEQNMEKILRHIFISKNYFGVDNVQLLTRRLIVNLTSPDDIELKFSIKQIEKEALKKIKENEIASLKNVADGVLPEDLSLGKRVMIWFKEQARFGLGKLKGLFGRNYDENR